MCLFCSISFLSEKKESCFGSSKRETYKRCEDDAAVNTKHITKTVKLAANRHERIWFVNRAKYQSSSCKNEVK